MNLKKRCLLNLLIAILVMPAKSTKQRRFMGAELGRLREGKETQTGMSEEQLSDYASKSETFILSLIESYLDKHDDKLKCGHKTGDPDHIEDA